MFGYGTVMYRSAVVGLVDQVFLVDAMLILLAFVVLVIRCAGVLVDLWVDVVWRFFVW